jgi:hypothetical protein
MNLPSIILINLLVLTLNAQAEAGPAGNLIDEMQGVYKYRFKGSNADGTETWKAEDVIEIVPIDGSHIYFRAYEEGANGHNCHIFGVAAYEDDAFVYHDPKYSTIWNQRCSLRISLTKTVLKLSDVAGSNGESTCPMYCGARASLSDFSIARGSKRKIRYLDIVRASRQYKEAEEAFTNSTKEANKK